MSAPWPKVFETQVDKDDGTSDTDENNKWVVAWTADAVREYLVGMGHTVLYEPREIDVPMILEGGIDYWLVSIDDYALSGG